MKKLRLLAKTTDPALARQRMQERQVYFRQSSSNRYGGGSPIYYQSLNRPYVYVFPDWWSDSDLRAFGVSISATVLELEDEEHDAIITELDRRSAFDSTAGAEYE